MARLYKGKELKWAWGKKMEKKERESGAEPGPYAYLAYTPRDTIFKVHSD
jgi:hypothetical protein